MRWVLRDLYDYLLFGWFSSYSCFWYVKQMVQDTHYFSRWSPPMRFGIYRLLLLGFCRKDCRFRRPVLHVGTMPWAWKVGWRNLHEERLMWKQRGLISKGYFCTWIGWVFLTRFYRVKNCLISCHNFLYYYHPFFSFHFFFFSFENVLLPPDTCLFIFYLQTL